MSSPAGTLLAPRQRMKALERTTRWRLPIALVVTSSVVALACSDVKPGASANEAAAPSAHSAPEQPTPAMAMESASGSDSTVLKLAAATDTTLAGTPARLSVAHVQSVMSDRGFWIGVWGQQVYVFQTASTPARVQGGEAYAVIGSVRAAPHSAQGAPRGMTPIDIEALHAQHLYIAAESVTRTER